VGKAVKPLPWTRNSGRTSSHNQRKPDYSYNHLAKGYVKISWRKPGVKQGHTAEVNHLCGNERLDESKRFRKPSYPTF
jgi:hypothetical protein